MRLLRVAIALAVVAVSMAALGAEQQADKQEAAQPAAPEKIAAVVNGEKISEAELAAVVERQLRGRQLPPEALQQIRRLILQSLISGRLVDQFLADKKIEADPEKVDSAIQDIKERVAGAGPFS